MLNILLASAFAGLASAQFVDPGFGRPTTQTQMCADSGRQVSVLPFPATPCKIHPAKYTLQNTRGDMYHCVQYTAPGHN
jgi:hypothetical protein